MASSTRKQELMRTLSAAATLVLAASATALGATSANASTVDDCLAARPGAVMFDQVTDGNDVVCVDEFWKPSAGDDTYLWVPSTPNTKAKSATLVDPGRDTMSLELWDHPYVDQNAGTGFGGGTMLLSPVPVNDWPGITMTPEVVKLTPFDDQFGSLWQNGTTTNPCGTNALADIDFYLGAGNDTLRCITGRIFTGAGADDVLDGGWGTTVTTGDGNDVVTANAGTDTLVMGGGDDLAKVRSGGADVVQGGAGADRAIASKNDVVTSATKVLP